MVRETSINTYHDVIAEGLVGRRQRQVFEYLLKNPNKTDKELSVGLNIPINVITPRRGELVTFGMVEDCGIRPCGITSRRAHFWRVKDSFDIIKIKEIKKQKKEICQHCNGKGYILK